MSAPRITWAACGLVWAGAVAGTGLRVLVGWLIADVWATAVVNILGAGMLGWLVAYLETAVRQPWAAWIRLTCGVGLLGAFTTYSAFALDVIRLAPSPVGQGIYLSLTLGGGFAAAALGLKIGGRQR